MIAPLKEGIEAHLNALQVFAEKKEHIHALVEAEAAKKLLQELYYEIWMKTHTSGTGGNRDT